LPILGSKHGRQILNEIFIYAKDIFPSPGYLKGWRLFNLHWLLSPLDPQSFQELVFKAFKNYKHSGYFDCQEVRSIDQNLFFFKLKLLIFRWWWQLWMKLAMVKQRYWMNLFFVVFRSFVLLLNSIGKLIHNWCTCKLIIKLRLHMHLCFYVLVLYFVVFDIHLWKLYWNNYSPQAQWTLVNIHQCSLRLWRIIVKYFPILPYMTENNTGKLLYLLYLAMIHTA